MGSGSSSHSRHLGAPDLVPVGGRAEGEREEAWPGAPAERGEEYGDEREQTR